MREKEMFTLTRRKELGIKVHETFFNVLTNKKIHLIVSEDIVKVRESSEVVDRVGPYTYNASVGGLFSWDIQTTHCFIFLQTDELYYSTVIHECTHCVGRIYEMVRAEAPAGEELIAAGVGCLSEAVIRVLLENKFEVKTGN